MTDTIRRVKYVTAAVVVLLAVLVSLIVRVRLHPVRDAEPPQVHYFPADYRHGVLVSALTSLGVIEPDDDLFTVVAGAHGGFVTSGKLPCGLLTGSKSRAFRIPSGQTFQCGDALLQIHSSSHESTLVLTGFDNVALPVTIGSGHRFHRDDGVPRLVFPGPGVGIDHLHLRPPADCAAAPRGTIACAENGGASGSMLLFQNADAPRVLQHGERAALSEGAELWLGFVPFRFTRSKSGVIKIEVALEGRSGEGWLRTLGNRDWMGVELPAWPMVHEAAAGSKAVVHRFRSENTEFAAGHLSPARVEPEQEEEMQLLVDHELLCVDGVTRLRAAPALSLRDVSRPGCTDVEGQRRSIEPLTTEAAAEVRDALRDSRLRELIVSEAHRIEGAPTGRGDQDSVLLFDYRRSTAATAGGRAVNVPAAVVGVRPRATLYRVLPPQPAATASTIVFAPGTSAPVLEVLPRTRNLLLSLVTPHHPMQVCEGTVWSTATRFADGAMAVLPLGGVSFNGNDVSWVPGVPDTPPPKGCVTLRRDQKKTSIAASAGTSAAIVRHGTRIAVRTAPMALEDDDDVVLSATSFHFRAAELRAAVTEHGARRYPFEADAVQLLGLGLFSGGVEGSLDRPIREALGSAKTDLGRELELTIDGDLQRLVSRVLDRSIRRSLAADHEKELLPADAKAREVVADYESTRAAALLLDAENGHVLAAATTPRFDPWRYPPHAELLASMKRGESPPKDMQRYIENYAFRRAAEIGSTQKIGTSIALARAGRLEAPPPNDAGVSCNNKMSILYDSTGAETTLKCDKSTTHPVIQNGAPRRDSWQLAFQGSCNIYFGLSAADLVPRIAADPSRHSMNGATTEFRFPRSLQPGLDFRPLSLAHPTTGNGFLETAMLLGYRLEFRGAKGIPVQSANTYNGLQYPTAQAPWLPGLRVGRAFIYPTMPAPETFSNEFHGDVLWPAKNAVNVDKNPYQITAREPMRGYLLLGFGQNLTGSPLSMATMATPILNSGRAPVTPTIITRPRLAAPVPAPAPAAPLFSAEAQTVLQGGLTAVVNKGTGLHYFGHTIIPPGVIVGGKTGTITIDAVEPSSNSKDNYEVAFDYGCGVIGADLSPAAWSTLAGEAGAASVPRPAWGFAAGVASCARRNPGLPRAAAVPAGDLQRVWKHIAENAEGQRDERLVTSSAFVAALWPQPGQKSFLTRPLVLAVVADYHSSAGKEAAAALVEEILRFLSVRE